MSATALLARPPANPPPRAANTRVFAGSGAVLVVPRITTRGGRVCVVAAPEAPRLVTLLQAAR